MRVSEAWLREFYSCEKNTDELVQQLTMAGLEVDQVEPAAGHFSGVVVGIVRGITPHPNADRLRVCSVDIGEEALLSIVCGASNVQVDKKFPVAVVGAILPGDFKIKKSKLRGEPSLGMLCSAAELGLADNASGLMELAYDAPIGQDLRTYLQLEDYVLDIDLTPNRADCLSVIGLAREMAALNGEFFPVSEQPQIALGSQDCPVIKNLAVKECPKFFARKITGLDAKVATPLWMSERLRRSGIRSLGAIVDITNYVLLELGQPLHAYDAEKIDGDIVVRHAYDEEQLKLLSEQEISLTDSDLVIADEKGPLSLAGVMGGLASSVTSETKNIILECAYFAPMDMMGKARAYGLHTDSSHRFERGVDFTQQENALERVTELLITICGGSVGPVVSVCAPDMLPSRESIHLRRDKVAQLLGVVIPDSEIGLILKNLGMDVSPENDGWHVIPPAKRFDIAIERDLVEEIARVWGYDNLPVNKAFSSSANNATQVDNSFIDRIKMQLMGLGYNEAITYSFVDPNVQARLFPQVEPIRLQNPISSEMSVMRVSLWPGLLQAAMNNVQRQQGRVRLFESGLCFTGSLSAEKLEASIDQLGGITQEPYLAGLVLGDAQLEHWSNKNKLRLDFFDIKGDVESLLALCGYDSKKIRFASETHDVLHPGQAARIYIGDYPIGWVGMLHPGFQSHYGFHDNVFVFELELAALRHVGNKEFRPLSKYPSVRRDLALLVKESLPVENLLKVIDDLSLEYLQDVNVFDLYQGEALDKGEKSVGLALTLNAEVKTLTDSEIDAIVKIILDKLDEILNVRLRI